MTLQTMLQQLAFEFPLHSANISRISLVERRFDVLRVFLDADSLLEVEDPKKKESGLLLHLDYISWHADGRFGVYPVACNSHRQVPFVPGM